MVKGGKGRRRKTEDRRWTGEGRSATRRYRFTKTRGGEDGEKREAERRQECRGRRWQGPPLCVVFCAFQAILARQPVSRLLALLSRPLSPAPRARSPPPFLFVAYHRLLATKKKEKFSPPKKNLFRQRGAAVWTSRPRPRCFSLYVIRI